MYFWRPTLETFVSRPIALFVAISSLNSELIATEGITADRLGPCYTHGRGANQGRTAPGFPELHPCPEWAVSDPLAKVEPVRRMGAVGKPG